MYPTDRARTAQPRPTRELTGAAHAGIHLTSSAASSAIMVTYPRLSGRDNFLAMWRLSGHQSKRAHSPPCTKIEIRIFLRNLDLALTRDREPISGNFRSSRRASALQFATLRDSSHTWSHVFTRSGPTPHDRSVPKQKEERAMDETVFRLLIRNFHFGNRKYVSQVTPGHVKTVHYCFGK